jgi:bacterioferritin
MASQELLKLLNEAIAREIAVSIQYMWQHVQWVGIKGAVVRDIFQQTAVAEMKHAESIAERLFYLGGVPTTKPSPILVGEKIDEMLKNDAKAEEDAIVLYKQIIQVARDEGDETTNRLFRAILADEEDHHDTFTTLLEKD